MAKKEFTEALLDYLIDQAANMVDDFLNTPSSTHRWINPLYMDLAQMDKDGELEDSIKEIQEDYLGLTIEQIRDYYKNPGDYPPIRFEIRVDEDYEFWNPNIDYSAKPE